MKHYAEKYGVAGGRHEDATLVSKAQAARLLGLSQRSVRKLVQRGTLNEIDLGPGTRPRLRQRDVLEFARVGAGAEAPLG